MLEDKKWLTELMSSYSNMNNPVAEPAKEEVLNEECVECNESVEDSAEETQEETAEEVETLEEETVGYVDLKKASIKDGLM